MKRRPTFNPATYSISHLKREKARSLTVIATIALTVAFLLLTSSLLFGVISEIDPGKETLLGGTIPGSVDMFDEFQLDQDLSDRARTSLINYLMFTSVLVFVVAFFIMYNTMAISVKERRHEIGILRAVGYSTGEVMRLFLLEGAMVGFISWVAALFLGTPLIVNLAAYMIERGEEGFFFVQPSIPPQLIGISLALTLILTVGSTYFATIRPVRSSPVAMLRTRL